MDKHDVEIQDEKGQVPLTIALNNNNNDIVDILLDKMIEQKSNLNIRDHDGNTLLMHACAKNNKELVERLLANNVDVKIKNNKGKTALMVACSENVDKEIINKLINYETKSVVPSIESNESELNNSFLIASFANKNEVIKVMVQRTEKRETSL